MQLRQDNLRVSDYSFYAWFMAFRQKDVGFGLIRPPDVVIFRCCPLFFATQHLIFSTTDSKRLGSRSVAKNWPRRRAQLSPNCYKAWKSATFGLNYRPQSSLGWRFTSFRNGATYRTSRPLFWSSGDSLCPSVASLGGEGGPPGWHPPGGDTRVKSIKVIVMSKKVVSFQEK